MNASIYSEGRSVSNDCGNIEARGLLNVEPFKSHKNKFNIIYTDQQLDFDKFNCGYGYPYGKDSIPYLNCDWDSLKQEFPFNPDIVVILGKDFITSAPEDVILFGDLASADPTTPINHGFVHEFGHSFGGLGDEYTYPFSYNCNETDCWYTYSPDPCTEGDDEYCFEDLEKNLVPIPNEDTVGCPKWCEGYDKAKLIELNSECSQIDNIAECFQDSASCVWFELEHPWFGSQCVTRKTWEDIGINCTSGCYLGSHYSHLSFSPSCSEGGMMSNTIGDFNQISENHLSDVLECCFPIGDSEKCKAFSEKFNLPDDVNPYFKFAYDKFSKCSSNGISPQEDSKGKSPEICNLNNLGYRKLGEYCSEEGFGVQKEGDEDCENNFECVSNSCIDSKCVEKGFWTRIINWFRKLF